MSRSIRRAGKKRFALMAGTGALVIASALLFAVPAQAVLTGSPSKFESGNDPTTGVGNEIVNTAGDADWITVQSDAAYVHLTDKAASTTDDSFTPGQKQDTVCPSVEGHKNSPKDDFTHVASFNEQATNGDVYLYGATLRYAANGNASENIELKQGTSGLCPGSTTLYKRTAGDKLLAIDYLGGGNTPQFHLLTWVDSGACLVSNDTAPCWGATVASLSPAVAEGGVSIVNFTSAQNPISGTAVVAGQFAEFGVNLAAAGIIPNNGTCTSFAQTIWESRASGSSFVSSTKDVSVEDHTISNCSSVSVTKTGSDGGSQEGAEFTLYEGSDTAGDVVGTCTVNADGDCLPTFTDLNPGTYTIDETKVPDGYAADSKLPETFTLGSSENKSLSYEDVAQLGAIEITKTSIKASVPLEGADFSITGPNSYSNSVTTGSDGTVCVDGLPLGTYSVTETAAPDGYKIDDTSPHDVDVTKLSTCGDGSEATFGATDTPLTDILVTATSQASDGTQSSIHCEDSEGNTVGTDVDFTDPASETVTDLSPGTYICTVVIDP